MKNQHTSWDNKSVRKVEDGLSVNYVNLFSASTACMHNMAAWRSRTDGSDYGVYFTMEKIIN
jgi:hypothetical protein